MEEPDNGDIIPLSNCNPTVPLKKRDPRLVSSPCLHGISHTQMVYGLTSNGKRSAEAAFNAASTQPDGTAVSPKGLVFRGNTYYPLSQTELEWFADQSSRIVREVDIFESKSALGVDPKELQGFGTTLRGEVNEYLDVRNAFEARRDRMLSALEVTKTLSQLDPWVASWLTDIRPVETNDTFWPLLPAKEKIELWESSVNSSWTLLQSFAGPLFRAKSRLGKILATLSKRNRSDTETRASGRESTERADTAEPA